MDIENDQTAIATDDKIAKPHIASETFKSSINDRKLQHFDIIPKTIRWNTNNERSPLKVRRSQSYDEPRIGVYRNKSTKCVSMVIYNILTPAPHLRYSLTNNRYS